MVYTVVTVYTVNAAEPVFKGQYFSFKLDDCAKMIECKEKGAILRRFAVLLPYLFSL